MASPLADLIAAGKEFGVFQFYLPFILAFAIIYGILSKANIFGTERRGKTINIVVSGVLSLFLMAYTPAGVMFAEYIGTLFSGTVLVIVTIIGTMMILYVLGQLVGIDIPVKGDASKKWWILLFLMIAILMSVGVFVSSGGLAFFPGLTLPGVTLPGVPTLALPSLGLSFQDIAIILLFLGTIGIIYWMSREDKPAPAGK